MLSPRQHELLSVVLLAIGTSIIFLGYDVQAFFAESVIHSVHTINPEAISKYAGYYGYALHFFGFAFFSLFTASIDSVFSSKMCLVLVSIIFGIYYCGFYHINGYFYYFTQLLMGLGYALFNNAEGIYLAEHSSEKTLVVNSGLETGISHTSLATAGLFMIIFNYYFSDDIEKNLTYHHFSIGFIEITYSGLLVLTILGGGIFALLPSLQQDDAIARKAIPERFCPKQKFKRMISAMSHSNVLLLGVTSAYQGFFNSFNMGVYSTTLSFTHSLKDDVYLMGFYGLFIGIGEMAGLLILSPLMKLVPKHRLIFMISVHFVSMCVVFVLLLCTVPNLSTIHPTREENLLIQPGRWSVCLIGLLTGFADYALTLGRAVICQIALPEARAEVFSLTRMFMSIAACIILFVAPYLTLRFWVLTLFIGAASGTVSFIVVAKRTGRSIRPVVEDKA